MRLQFASDFHLEFPENREWLQVNPLQPVGDVLILAGDIMPLSGLDHLSSFLDEWSRISDSRASQIARSVNDFFKIKKNGSS
jgi:predicted phosphodiesterase